MIRGPAISSMKVIRHERRPVSFCYDFKRTEMSGITFANHSDAFLVDGITIKLKGHRGKNHSRHPRMMLEIAYELTRMPTLIKA